MLPVTLQDTRLLNVKRKYHRSCTGRLSHYFALLSFLSRGRLLKNHWPDDNYGLNTTQENGEVSSEADMRRNVFIETIRVLYNKVRVQ